MADAKTADRTGHEWFLEFCNLLTPATKRRYINQILAQGRLEGAKAMKKRCIGELAVQTDKALAAGCATEADHWRNAEECLRLCVEPAAVVAAMEKA